MIEAIQLAEKIARSESRLQYFLQDEAPAYLINKEKSILRKTQRQGAKNPLVVKFLSQARLKVKRLRDREKFFEEHTVLTPLIKSSEAFMHFLCGLITKESIPDVGDSATNASWMKFREALLSNRHADVVEAVYEILKDIHNDLLLADLPPPPPERYVYRDQPVKYDPKLN